MWPDHNVVFPFFTFVTQRYYCQCGPSQVPMMITDGYFLLFFWFFCATMLMRILDTDPKDEGGLIKLRLQNTITGPGQRERREAA